MSTGLVLCNPLLILQVFASFRLFSELALHIRWPNYWSFSSILPVNIQSWFPLGLTGLISLLSKVLLIVFSSTTIQKHQFISTQPYGPTFACVHDYWKKIVALTIWTFVGKVMSLIFNTLSRSIIAFLRRSKHLLILWLQSLSTVKLEPKKIKSVTASTLSPSICHEVVGPRAMIFIFQPEFLLSSFTLIKRLFSSSLLSAIRVLFICISGVVTISTSNLDSSF